MWYLRFQLPGQAQPRFGRVLPENPTEIEVLSGDFLSPETTPTPTGERHPIDFDALQRSADTGTTALRLLCPVVPSKIVGVGSNYRNHTVEMGKPIPDEPLLFLKPPSALLPPGGRIIRPAGYQRVDYEGELAIIVGKTMRRVAEQKVAEHLFGYTALNDVTVRDLQRKDGQFTRGKGFDTFCPLGPAVRTDFDPATFRLTTRLNGKQVQDSASDTFLFSVYQLLSFISQVMTLLPGDVVTTGTPAGVGDLSPGDEIEIEIAGLPALRNGVIAGPEFLGRLG